MQSKFSAEILYPLMFKAPRKANGRHYKPFETNLLIPEGVAFISSKSGVDTLRGGKVMSEARTDGQTDQTDGFSVLYSRNTYIYIYIYIYIYSLSLLLA